MEKFAERKTTVDAFNRGYKRGVAHAYLHAALVWVVVGAALATGTAAVLRTLGVW